MTLWDFLLPWRVAKARDTAETALAHSRKRVRQLETELQQTMRAGLEDVADKFGVSFEDIKDGKIEPMLHDDPQAVYRALDNATASEVKFRQVKGVNRELRLVIRQIITGLHLLDLGPDERLFLAQAEPYAALTKDVTWEWGPEKPKRKILHLQYPKGKDDEAQAEAETKA